MVNREACERGRRSISNRRLDQGRDRRRGASAVTGSASDILLRTHSLSDSRAVETPDRGEASYETNGHPANGLAFGNRTLAQSLSAIELSRARSCRHADDSTRASVSGIRISGLIADRSNPASPCIELGKIPKLPMAGCAGVRMAEASPLAYR